jgi:hypothetical protein
MGVNGEPVGVTTEPATHCAFDIDIHAPVCNEVRLNQSTPDVFPADKLPFNDNVQRFG